MPNVTQAEIKEFVEAAHGDLPKVQRLLVAKPELLTQPNGNETALGAACQMRRADIIGYLLAQGEEMDISAACVLGLTERVTAFLDTDPTLLSRGNKKAHNKHPLYFAENQPETLALLKARGAK
jgi:hypothetical protein